MILEIKDLAPYSPYGLNFVVIDVQSQEWITQCLSEIDLSNEMIVVGNDIFDINYLPKQDGIICKPILRPLTEITYESGILHTPESILNLKVSYYNRLISRHYDVFGLIDKGLAIDINTI